MRLICLSYLILLLILPVAAWSQSEADLQRVDSLKEVLATTIATAEKFEVLLALAEAYKNIDPSQTRQLATRALQLVKTTDKYYEIGQAHTLIARGYFQEGLFHQALQHHVEALEQYRKLNDSLKIAGAYQNLGEDYRLLYEAGNAVKYYLKALQIYEKGGHTDKIASIHNNIGITQRNTGGYQEALKSFNKALDYTGNDSLNLFRTMVLNNIGNVYLNLENYEKASQYHLKALRIRRKIGNAYYISGSLLNLALIKHNTKAYPEALDYFQEVIEISKEIKDSYTLALAYYSMGNSLLKSGRADSASAALNKAFEIAKPQGNLLLLTEIYGLLADVAQKKGSSQQALEYELQKYRYQDTINQKEKDQELARLQTQFQTVQKEREIELLQKENELAAVWRNMLLSGLLLAVVIIFLIFWIFRIRIRKKKVILKKQAELHQKREQLRNVELEKVQLKEQQLQMELDYKSRQLTTHTLNIIQKNKMFEELQGKLHELGNANGQRTSKLHEINRFINYSLDIDRDWEEFRSYFDQVNNNFFIELKQNYRELSPADLRLAALVKLNMSIKEAAAVLNISPGSVKTARYRLRKKLSLPKDTDLNDFLITYHSSPHD